MAEVTDAGGAHVRLDLRPPIADEAEVAKPRAACRREGTNE